MSEARHPIAGLRRAYEAFSRGDFDAAIELVDPGIEAATTGGTILRGIDEFRAWMEPETLENRTMEPESFVVAGPNVLVRLLSRGRGVRSGISIEANYWAVWTFNEAGLATRMVAFRDEDEAKARRAAGLPEQAVSEENIQPFRDMMDAYTRGDRAAWKTFIDPALETIPAPMWPEPGPIIGPDAAWDFYRQFEETLHLREGYEISELIGAGGRVFICQQARVRGHASGADVIFRLWGVHTFSGGRIVRTQWFNERSEALEAAGLTEWTMSDGD